MNSILELFLFFLVGLDNAGKTTILYKLKLGKVMETIPTIAFNVETIDYKNFCFTIKDVSGQERSRLLWRHHFPNTQGIIFVIDSNDPERIEEIKVDINYLMEEDELNDAMFLFLANKQDLPNAKSTREIVEKLKLNTRYANRIWHIQQTCATSGEGIYEGLEWLSKELSKK